MEKIASFRIDHDKLTKGLYISRIDGDVVTYDLRMKLPNGEDYLAPAVAHTLEHLLATYLRNSEIGNEVVYVGPMGCRTGFYILLRDTISPEAAIVEIYVALCVAANYMGDIPGATRAECGNYRDHDLVGARIEARKMLPILRMWTKGQLKYPE